MNVPAVPAVSAEVEAAHVAAHAALAEAVERAADEVQRAFVFLQRRIQIESLAHIDPVSARPADQLIVPAPRAFLTRTHELRLQGADAAFRHLDSRATMYRAGMIGHVVAHTTPLALHALFEGVSPSGRETNAGMWRVTPTSWRPEANPFEHPPSTEVEGLMAEAVDTANGADRPAFVRAAWLTFTTLSIHPFVDGNGRTARALALGVSSEALELGVDWGLAEQWSIARRAYVEALQAGQQASSYDGRRLDAWPFVAFSADASTVGARLCLRRVETLEAEFERLVAAGLSAHAALLMLSVRCARFVEPDDIGTLGLEPSAADLAVAELVDRSLIEWRPRPPSRTTIRRSKHGLVVTDA